MQTNFFCCLCFQEQSLSHRQKDPRSGIRKKIIPDTYPQKSTGAGVRIRIRNTAFSAGYSSGATQHGLNLDLNVVNFFKILCLFCFRSWTKCTAFSHIFRAPTLHLVERTKLLTNSLTCPPWQWSILRYFKVPLFITGKIAYNI
jgi:hypothetical protein